MPTDPSAVTLQVVAALDAQNIPYFIGGSLASAVHGVVRSTLDADLIADLHLEQVAAFVHALSGEFSIDPLMVVDAVDRLGSFNIIHYETMFKVDIFISQDSAFERSQFARRSLVQFEPESGRSAYVTSAEDIILAKLCWYRQGGEVSDRQWEDVRSVIWVQGERLDRSYIANWADRLGITDLWQRLRPDLP